LLNRMTSEKEPFGIALTVAYDANANRTSMLDSFGGVTTSTYDLLNRLATLQFGGAGQTPLRVLPGLKVSCEISDACSTNGTSAVRFRLFLGECFGGAGGIDLSLLRHWLRLRFEGSGTEVVRVRGVESAAANLGGICAKGAQL